MTWTYGIKPLGVGLSEMASIFLASSSSSIQRSTVLESKTWIALKMLLAIFPLNATFSSSENPAEWMILICLMKVDFPASPQPRRRIRCSLWRLRFSAFRSTYCGEWEGKVLTFLLNLRWLLGRWRKKNTCWITQSNSLGLETTKTYIHSQPITPLAFKPTRQNKLKIHVLLRNKN